MSEKAIKKVPLWETTKKTHLDFKNNFKKICVQAWFWLFAVTAVDFIFRYPYPCAFPNVRDRFFNCSDDLTMRLSAITVQIFFVISFVVLLIRILTENKVPDIRAKRFFKEIGTVLILVILFLMPIFSFYVLLNREANHHTLIELSVFILSMIPFFGPIYVIRMMLAPFFIESGNPKYLGFLESIKYTSHNFFNITLGIFFNLGLTIVYLLIPKFYLMIIMLNLGMVGIVLVSTLFNAVLLAQIAILTIYVFNVKQKLQGCES
ncbi:MAG: hypothetical protein AB7U85_05665 [Alphaproteobacteria bacterium]